MITQLRKLLFPDKKPSKDVLLHRHVFLFNEVRLRDDDFIKNTLTHLPTESDAFKIMVEELVFRDKMRKREDKVCEFIVRNKDEAK